MSPAFIPHSPIRSLATSPAMPWRKTPATAACCGSIPCAMSPAMVPVRTSPDPAVAIPALPVGLAKRRPSSRATSVGAPLITMVTPQWRANCRAWAISGVGGESSEAVSGFWSSSWLTSIPASLANSPRCGVKTTGACRFSTISAISAAAANALSPSASTTAGGPGVARQRRTSSAVSLWAPNPRPMARQSAR